MRQPTSKRIVPSEKKSIVRPLLLGKKTKEEHIANNYGDRTQGRESNVEYVVIINVPVDLVHHIITPKEINKGTGRVVINIKTQDNRRFEFLWAGPTDVVKSKVWLDAEIDSNFLP